MKILTQTYYVAGLVLLIPFMVVTTAAGCEDGTESADNKDAGADDNDTSAEGEDSGIEDNADAGLPLRSTVPLPNGDVGIGFDDLQYSPFLDRIIAPAGRAGYIALVDPHTMEVTRVGSFSEAEDYYAGHDQGTTSAVEAEGMVYAIDRSTSTLSQVDVESGEVVGSIDLAAKPDYVRWVSSTRELWVTEPTAFQFEIVSLTDDSPPQLQNSGNVSVALGPESLVVNESGTMGYTNTFVGSTLEYDVGTRELTSSWSNGCSISLGIAIDEERGFVFIGCPEGKAVALDLDTGDELSTLEVGGGVDIISYNPNLSHLYLNSSSDGFLAIVDVSSQGELSLLETVETATSTNASCVVADPYDNIWVCDPNRGQLLRISDTF